MAWDQYAVTLRHDRGQITIITSASDAAAAVRTVCTAEGAPISAVVQVRPSGRRKVSVWTCKGCGEPSPACICEDEDGLDWHARDPQALADLLDSKG